MDFSGLVELPGGTELKDIVISIDGDAGAISMKIADATLDAENVRIAQRLNYTEAVFTTSGVPMEGVALTWKFNAGYESGSLAGVIIAQPNPHRVAGEKGFNLERA